MAVGALIVAIASALAAVGLTLYARQQDKTATDALEATRVAAAAAKESAAASERSASAAEAGVALERDALEATRVAAAAAKESAAASERSASAAEAARALETGRRHEELAPRYRVEVIPKGPGLPFPMMSVFLVGPPELGDIDGLTVTIRDTNPWPSFWQESQMPEPATPEQLAEGIYGPYRFYPDPHTDAAGRVASREGMQVGDELRFSLDPTSPPLWSSWEQGPWHVWMGTLMRLRLEARREGWEPWTRLCEIDSAVDAGHGRATVEVP